MLARGIYINVIHPVTITCSQLLVNAYLFQVVISPRKVSMQSLHELKEFVYSLSLSDRQELLKYLEGLNDDQDLLSIVSISLEFTTLPI